MVSNDTFIETEARRIREHFRAQELAAYLRGFTEGQSLERIHNERHNPATVIGSRYTTTGRFDDEPRENEVEYDSHLYATPKEVWEKEWLRTWMEMNESVGTLITQDEYFRVGYMIAEMARKNAVGRVKFTYGRGIYVYETLEVELSMRVIS